MQTTTIMLRALLFVMTLVFVGLCLLGGTLMGVAGIGFYMIALVVVFAAGGAMVKRRELIHDEI